MHRAGRKRATAVPAIKVTRAVLSEAERLSGELQLAAINDLCLVTPLASRNNSRGVRRASHTTVRRLIPEHRSD